MTLKSCRCTAAFWNRRVAIATGIGSVSAAAYAGPAAEKEGGPGGSAALIYLKTRIFGAEDYARYRHVVVDEAQDLGEFAFFALQKLLSGSTFTVVGDLAQSIYGFHGIESWEPVQKRSFSQGAEICHMEKSYRTTVEIMEAANLLTESMGLPAAQPGDPPWQTRYVCTQYSGTRFKR